MKTPFLLIALLLGHWCSAQITIYIVDEYTHPLSYVNVFNTRTQNGGYTDDEGRFVFSKDETRPADEIRLSHLGYDEMTFAAENLQALSTPVVMKAKNYNLNEVTVKPVDAKNMLREVLARAKENFPATFTKHEIVFKDYSKISGKKNHYYFFHYNTWLPSYEYRKEDNTYTQVLQHELYNSGNGMFDFNGMSPAQLTMIMYPNNLFSEKELAKHDYQYLASINYEGEELDVIAVQDLPKKKDDFIAVRGKIYLTKNKAIRMMEVHIYNEASKRFFLVAKMDSLNVNIKVLYKPVGEKYVLDYISQTTYAAGKIFGKAMNLAYSTTAKVLGTELNVADRQIPKLHQVEEILKEEKAKPASQLGLEPDMQK
ncbi:MAG: carboxypeptidase-like regulatory domain-containing protein [Chitinophagales bacterium]